MTLKVEFETDSSVFSCNMGKEIGWVLRDLADKIDGDGVAGSIWDQNGNIIGWFELTD